MFDNPLAAARLIANAALVAVMAAFVGRVLFFDPGNMVPWIWAIGGVAIAGALVQMLVSILVPRAIRPAWDEQVVRTHASSQAFGYWMTLLAFLGLFLATRLDWMPAEAAFYWLAPVLAAAPSVYMLGASLGGRAG